MLTCNLYSRPCTQQQQAWQLDIEQQFLTIRECKFQKLYRQYLTSTTRQEEHSFENPENVYEPPAWAKIDVPPAPQEFGTGVQSQMNDKFWQESSSRVDKPRISSANTTLIGDFSVSIFPEFSSTWYRKCDICISSAGDLEELNHGQQKIHIP